ncbi:hypothetical protein TTHERM_000251239 (macronuclear) [Tetrahymena thermophila SB210]|uniref:Transmembrane protein n=1 Tax=Tetrahymena thermophila (strain SB210) TaxID=312017 RepID=W7XIU0_TETTS|nr:hypothetical protein TTHERM_000251239 [Tetrahymena thermophila SB210]EWS73604.1 hypothetical protein TTHERM_000251239 [Tetrahymena thermophila SB210]|eukprot:XP_012653834.1 hypothetical protein TTHERM_000251239 [Tetrahymena thermophila SB210]
MRQFILLFLTICKILEDISIVIAQESITIEPIFIKNTNTEYGQATFYQLKFFYGKSIVDGNANIIVSFPHQIELQYFPQYIECYYKVDTTEHQTVPCEYNKERQVYINVKSIISGEQSIAIGPILNPNNVPGTSFFKLCILYNDYPTECNDSFGKVYFGRQPALMPFADVQYKSSLQVNEGSSWIFDFKLLGIYENNLFSIRITFPEGFKTKSALCDIQGSQTKPQTIILFNQRMIECQNIAKQLKGSLQIRIINMINPNSIGDLKNFQIELLQQSNGLIFERIIFNPKLDILLNVGNMKANLIQENNFKFSNSTLTFQINPTNKLGEGGTLQIIFGQQWKLWALNCTIVKGFSRYSGKFPNCFLNSNDNSYKIQNFKEIDFTQQIVVKIIAQSPKSEGNFPIIVQTLNLRQKIVDQSTVTALTNSTFGSLKRFTASAVRNQIKLQAGKAGPLESTFFLKHNLPATNYKSVGKVVIDIFPKIPKPSTDYGIIKCYFYGNILASSCDFNDKTYADRTKITIYTPENYDFQESEIPITVTTEGSKPGYNDGILLDPLVKRYLFHYHFYDNDLPASEPTEVYYQEWVPDSFEIPDIDFKYNVLIREKNEYTHMRFEMKQQITLPYGDRNYLFRVTFIKDIINVWQIGQPYENNYAIIEDFPCYLYGSTTVANPFSKCDLYQQSFRDPFIQAYGFETLKIQKGNWIILEIPQILIANVPTGSKGTLRFSLMEETPGMINPEVELYYKQISVEILEQSFINYSFNPNIATTLIPPIVNQQTDLRFQWSAAVYDPQYLIYEIDLVGYYDIGRGIIQSTNCDGNQCIKFQKPVHWIVIYPNTPLNQQIITNILGVFQNPNYADQFIFKVRAMKNGVVVNKHTFNVKVGSADILNKIFDICNPNHVINSINGLIRKNEEHEFYIKFNTRTSMPRNSLIRFSFRNIQTQTQTDRHINFCRIVSGLVPYDKTPIQCKAVSTSIIEISHFEQVLQNVPIEIHIRLLIDGSATINPSVDIETFYGPKNEKLIDSTYSISSNTPNISTNNVDSEVKFKVLDEAVRSEKREKGYIGPVIFDFTPNIITNIKYIKIKFDASFSTPRNYGTDSLICLVNEVRFECVYSINPLYVLVDITSNALQASSAYRLSISTEYVSPLDGLVHPKTEGFYPIHFQLLDINGFTNQATRWIFIKAAKLQFIYIESVIRNQKRANMFYVNFKTTLPVQKHSSGGRIHIEFPTLDPMGNPLFDLDLGGYQQSGDEVGCRFIKQGVTAGDIGDINDNRCRLIKSQRRGNPAVVEIINFPSLPAGTEIQMWIAKVFNPPNFNYPSQPTLQVMDANISINIFEQNPLTGDLKYIHYDTYNVFMDIRDDPTLHDATHPFSSQKVNQVWETGSQVNSKLKSMVNQVWYDISPFASGDFYIVELPNNFPDTLKPDWKMATCLTFYDWCLTFPQINWVVMHINTNLVANVMYASNDVLIQVLPQSVPQITTTYQSYVWQGRFFRGYVIHQVTPQQWLQLVGTIRNYGLTQLDSPNKLVKGRTRVEVNFNFTNSNFIPYYGAIQIRFPSRIASIQSHCRSSITVGSGLQSKVGPFGNVGCLVQDQNTWVIYGFSDINPLTNIKIQGVIDLPNDGNAGYIGELDVITYGSHEYDNIFNKGRIIDKSLTLSKSGFTIDNFQTKQIEDIDLLHIETKTLRNANRTPLTFKFKIGYNIFANRGRIRLMFYQYSQLSFNDYIGNSFQYFPTSQYVCNIQVANTKENYGCKIELITLQNQGYNQIYYLFQMIPNSDLLSNVDYLFTLTTIDGDGQDEGLTFPNSGLPYKIDVSMSIQEPKGDSDYTLHQHLYYQVYGQSFAYLKFTSYVTLKNEMNLFIIEFQPGQTIRNDDTLVIEIPTASIDLQDNLFADDGGLSLNNQDIVVNDIIDMSPTYPNPTMECRISRGFQIKGLPIKFLCSNFKSSGILKDIGDNDRMKVAFNIQNPDVTVNHYSIPAQVYVQRNYKNANEKILYDFVENAFYIHFWSPQIISLVNGDFNVGSTTQTVCNTLTDFKFRVRNSQNLVGKNEDAYILRFNFELRDDEYLHKKNCAYIITGNPPHNCATLPNLRAFIAWPHTTQDLVAPIQIQTTGNKWLTSFYREQNDIKRQIVGYACYVKELWSEKVIYQDLYPDLQPNRVETVYFDLRFKNIDYHFANEKMDFIMEVTAPYWYYTERVVITFPINIGWALVGDMCLESPGSNIEVTKCWFVNNSGQIQAWIDIAQKDSYVNGDQNSRQTLLIESHMEAFQVPSNQVLNPSFSSFSVKFYQWSRLPSMQPSPWRSDPPITLDPTTEKYSCFTNSATMRAGQNFAVVPSQTWDVNWQSESTIEFDYEYHRYLDEFVPCFKTQRAPIKMDIYSPTALSSLKGTQNYHTFDFYYGSDVIIPTPLEIKDYVQDKLICWVNNDRVKCENDQKKNKIRLYFQTQIAVNGLMFIFITSHDTNDITNEGFSYQGDQYQYKWLYEISQFGGQTYYGYTDPFPIMYNTNGGIKCPHRGIEDGDLADSSTQIANHLTGYWFWFRFARPDILGITFNFRPRDYDNRDLYNPSFFMGLDNGAQYPCSRGISGGKRNDVRCIYEKGDNTGFGISHRVHVFDFNYQVGTNEIFGLLFNGITNVFKITVEAWGGKATFNQPYGNYFMGSLIFDAWWGPWNGVCITPNSCKECDNTQNNCDYQGTVFVKPEKPAFMDKNILHFQNTCQPGTQSTVFVEIVLQKKSSFDSNYVEVCQVDPQIHVKDMFIYEKYEWAAIPGQNEYVKKAYLYYDFSDGKVNDINIGYFKCKHYNQNIITYYQCGDLKASNLRLHIRFETQTNRICEQRYGATFKECDNTSTSTNEFVADKYTINANDFNNDYDFKIWKFNEDTWTTLAVRLFDVHNNAFNNPYYDSVLTFNYDSFLNTPNFGIPSECYVVEGLRMSDRRKLGEEPQCQVLPNPNNSSPLAFIFKITNWDTIVTNEYVRILFRHHIMQYVLNVYNVPDYSPFVMNLYANNEAYGDGKNGHMNSRKWVNPYNFYFCWNINHNFVVLDFNYQGPDTVLLAQAQVNTNIGFHLNNNDCTYNQCIELVMFGLQDYVMSKTITVQWYINDLLNPCTDWADFRWKGIHRWTMCFDQNRSCLQNGWNTNQILKFRITFQGVQIPLDRNYWWVHMKLYENVLYERYAGGCAHRGWEFMCQNDEWVNNFNIGTNLAVNLLSLSYNSITEVDFTITSIYESIGLDINVNRILIMELSGQDWLDNPIYGTQYDLQEINCACGVNTLVLSPQICVKRNRRTVVGRIYDPVVLFYFSAPKGSTVRCSVPEIIIEPQAAAPRSRKLKFKIIRPSLYEWYGKNGEQFNSRVKSEYQFTPIPNTSTSDLNLQYDPPVFYQDRTTTELFLGYYDLQISNIKNLNTPYVYVRHSEIGPLMTTELCEDKGLWDPNYTKVYNQHTKVLICRRITSTATNAVIGAGKNLYFEQWKSQKTTDYQYYVFVYQSTELKQQQSSALIANNLFQPIKTSNFIIDHFFYSYNKSSDQSIIAIQIGLRGFLWRETRDGGRVEIYLLRSQVTGITPACTARIEKEFQHVLWCYVDNRNIDYWIIVVHNLFTQIQTNNYLNVYFSMINPSGATNRSVQYIVKFYYNYKSDSDYQVQIQDSFTQSNFDFSEYDKGYIRITNSMSHFYGFKPKVFIDRRYEQRFYAKIMSPKVYLERIDFYTNELCVEPGFDCNFLLDVRVREYDTSLLQRYQEIEVRGRSWIGAGFIVQQPPYRVYNQGSKLEFIISTRRTNSHIGLWKQTNENRNGHMFVYDTADDIKTIKCNEHQSNTKYNDFSTNKQTDELRLQYFYFTNQIHNQLTSFVIGMLVKSGSTIDYPRIYFELKFPILKVANIPGAIHGNSIPCQISLVLEAQNPNRINSARCRVFDINTKSYQGLMVRIEEVNQFSPQSVLTFAFDDWLLPDSTNGYTPIDIEFNLYRASSPTSGSLDYSRYFLLLKEMILVDGMNPLIWDNAAITPIQLKPPNSYVYGKRNVEYNDNIINPWPKQTVGYFDTWGQQNTAGQKMRLIFTNGFIGGDNTPDSLNYYDGFGQLQLLWFNRKTRSAYISAPKRDINNSINFSIKNAVNPYPYQKDAWNSNGKINYQLYMGQYWNFAGDGFRQTNLGVIELSSNAQWSQFIKDLPTINIDLSQSHLIDVIPKYNYASNQSITMRFRITHQISKAERVKRQLTNVVFDFTQGVKVIHKCFIQSEGQKQNIFISRYADCQIGFSNNRYNAQLIGIANWEDTAPYQMFLQMQIDKDTIAYTISTYTQNGQVEYFKQVTVPSNQFSKDHYTFNYFRFIEGKYISGYHEIAQRNIYTNSAISTTQRLRFRFVLDVALNYKQTKTFVDPMTNADYLQIKLPPLLTNGYIQRDPNQWLMCYFVPEISTYDKLALPLYSKCKIDTSGNTYFYILTAPRDILVNGRAYVIHITEKRIQGASFILPQIPQRSEFIWYCYSPFDTATPSYDTFITRITNRFLKAKINHLTTTSEDYDVAEITFIPSVPLSQKQESYFLVEIDSNYFQKMGLNYEDFDIINSYKRDGLPEFINGYDHSYLIEPPFQNGFSLVNFGQHSNFYANIMINHVYGQDLNAGKQYVFKIPMIKNPKNQHISLSYKISTVYISNQDMRKQILDEFWFINHAYVDTVHTDMTSINFKMNSINDYVMQNTMDLSVQFNYNIGPPQRILLKWDNNNDKAIDRTQLMTIQISGCKVEVFDKIYLIMVTPLSYQQQAWSIMSLGTNFKSNTYAVQYGFWFTYITNKSLTQYYHNPQQQWLRPLEDLTPKIFAQKVGYQTINSVCLYRLVISTPNQVPIGGYIEINLSNELDGYEPYCYTYTTFNLIDSTNPKQVKYGPLECQMKNSKQYIIKGFDSFTSPTNINVDLYLKNVNSGAVVNLQNVIMYGTQNSQNIIAISKPVPQVTILSSNPGMIQFEILDRVSYPIYAKEWQKLDFVFTLRSNNLIINQNYKLKFNLPAGWISAIGSRLQLKGRYKRNDPSIMPFDTYPSPPYKYKDWTTSKFSIEGDKLVFDINVDDPLLSHYSINQQIEYIFSIDSQRADIAFQEGLLNLDRGLYNFYLEAFQNNKLLERTYNEYYVKPREDVSDTFRVQVLNTGAAQKTAIRFSFTMNYDKAVQGDEIWIEFQTFDRLKNVFKIDLGLGFSDISAQIGCSERFGFNKISKQRILCYVFKGNQNLLAPQRGTPVIIKIPIQKVIPSTELVDFWIAYVENPIIVGQVAGIKLSVRRDCRDDSPHFNCILYHAEHQYYITEPLPVSQYSINGAFSANSNIVTLKASHTFTIKSSIDIQSNQYILIQYPSNHKNKNTCSSQVGECIEFSEYNWVLFKPSALIKAGLDTSIQLDNMINGWHRRNPSPDNYFLLQVFDNNGNIVQPYKITHNYYDYYIININGQIMNTQTYDPKYRVVTVFLKENFMNLAQLDVMNMDIEQEINYFRLDKPKEISKFDFNYCNATLTLIPETLRLPYPLRYDCEVHDQYILLIRTKYFLPWNSSFNKFNLRIYFKFIIDDKIPPNSGVSPGSASPFILYGCIARCDDPFDSKNNQPWSHVTKSNIPWDISYYQQPNLNTAGFYTESFYQRQAQIDEKVSLQMLIQPNTICDVNQLVFTVPDEFIYPSTQMLDKCTIQGVKPVSIDLCSVSRRQGQTQVKIILKEKLGDLAKIVTISDKNGNQLFVAPPYPGTFYPIKLDMYCNSKLAETQFTNFTNVRGENLDVNYLKVINSLDELTPQLYEFQFKTGKHVIPLGYQRTVQGQLSQGVYSTINIVFEWIGDGYTVHPGYASDLGMNISDNSEVGCAIKTGLTLSQGSKLNCILSLGKGPEKMPQISISNYEQIPANTQISILITNIQSISASLLTTVKIGVIIKNPKFNSDAYFYNLVAYIPDKTSALNSPITSSNSDVIVTGNSQIHSSSNYQFTFNLGKRVLKVTDYFGIQFPENFINTLIYDTSAINCGSTCSFIYVFPATSMVYLQPKTNLDADSKVIFQINGIPNPNYAIRGLVQIQQFTFIDRKIDSKYVTQFSANFAPSSLFQSANVEISSQTGGETNVQYTFQFQLGHTIPADGAISIDFPLDLYDNPKQTSEPLICKLQGDVFNEFNQSVCKFAAPNKLSVALVNTQLLPNSVYKIIVDGITNPNKSYDQANKQQSFVFSSHFNNNAILNQIIAQKTANPPPFYVTALKKCIIKVSPFIKNIKLKSFYSFQFSCNVQIKNKSIVEIILPIEYSMNNKLDTYDCSSFEQSTLYTKQCTLQEIKGLLILSVQLREIKSSQQFTINLNLFNPSIANSNYIFSAQFKLQNQYFANTQNTGTNFASIFDFPKLIFAKNQDSHTQIKLQNVPINAAEPAFYIFKTPSLKNMIQIQEISITFPNHFSKNLGDNLKCYIYYSNNETHRFSIHDILKLKAKQISGYQNFIQLPCSISYDFTITLSSVGSFYNQSLFEWNYIMVQNVYNPGKFYLDTYKIIHSSDQVASWVFEDYLYYEISDIAKQLDIKNIESKINSTTVLSPYIFEIYTLQQLKKNTVTAIMIDLPDQYDTSLQPQDISCYGSISQTIKTNCKLYNNIILSWSEITKVENIFHYLYIESLINPSIKDPCTDKQFKNSNFKISILDLSTNEILATSKPNKQTCLKYTKDFLYIKINGPNKLVKGLSYSFKVEIERPANVLKLIPKYNNLYFDLIPNILVFKDFDLPSEINFKILVKENAQLGAQSINFDKIETIEDSSFKSGDQYQLPPILKFDIVENQSIDQTLKYVFIEDFKANSVGGIVTAFINVPEPPAQNMYLNIDITNSKNIKVQPSKILITHQEKNYNFTIQYLSEQVTVPIPFYFSLQSNQKVMHQLFPSVKYLVITSNNQHSKNKIAKLEFMNNIPHENYYKIHLGKSIDTNLIQTSELQPEILSIKIASLQQNKAILYVITSQPGSIKYLITYKNSKPPLSAQEVFSFNYSEGIIIKKGEGHTKQYFTEATDFTAEIKIEELNYSTSYQIYAVCNNGMGISKIKSANFTTSYLQAGTIFHVTLSNNLNSQDLIKQLSQALRIKQNDMALLTSKQIINNQGERLKNDLFSFEIAIAPQSNGFNINEYLQNITQSNPETFIRLMKNYVQGFETYRVEPFSRKYMNGMTKITDLKPKIESVSFYSANITVRLWEESIIYAVVLEDQNNLNITLLSQQIILGFDQHNNPVKEFWSAKSYSNSSNYNQANLHFDNLNDGKNYTVYMTATNVMPYPEQLKYLPLQDNHVMTFKFFTPFNYNLDNCLMVDYLKDVNAGLSQIIEKRYETEKQFGFCKSVKKFTNSTQQLIGQFNY